MAVEMVGQTEIQETMEPLIQAGAQVVVVAQEMVLRVLVATVVQV